jgi:hypothetical protein
MTILTAEARRCKDEVFKVSEGQFLPQRRGGAKQVKKESKGSFASGDANPTPNMGVKK